MSLLFRTHFRLARVSIKENRTRSFLTCLGIAIGVASIILILSLMGSITNLVHDEIGEIGHGIHKRVIVNSQKFLDKAYSKL